MDFAPTRLPEVIVITLHPRADERGYFMETWQKRRFAAAGIPARFVQGNHSHSTHHVLRGMHYQIRQPQGKLVRVVQGSAYDVVVDLRRQSSRFGQWVGVELNAARPQMLWVPPGFAHGYLSLSDSVDFLYQCTDYYAPEHERTLRWDDTAVGIQWPLPAGVVPNISPKDLQAPLLAAADNYP